MKRNEDMTLEEAKALIAKVDALEAQGKLSTEGECMAAGYVYDEDSWTEDGKGIMQLPIPIEICRQLEAERREQGAKLLHDLCNTDDPKEQDRLVRDLDAQWMQDDPLVQRLKEYEALPEGSPERLKTFKRALQTVHEEHKLIVTDENYSEMLKRFRSLVPHTPEWEAFWRKTKLKPLLWVLETRLGRRTMVPCVQATAAVRQGARA
jgi:hypothetical protein